MGDATLELTATSPDEYSGLFIGLRIYGKAVLGEQAQQGRTRRKGDSACLFVAQAFGNGEANTLVGKGVLAVSAETLCFT
jgi:hypothetical protein